MLSKSKGKLQESTNPRKASETSLAPQGCGADYQSSSNAPARVSGPSRFSQRAHCVARESRAGVANRRAPSADAARQRPHSATEIRRKVLCPSPAPFSRKYLRKDRDLEACCRAPCRPARIQMHQCRRFLCQCRNPREKDPGIRPTQPKRKGRFRWAPRTPSGKTTLLVSLAATV